MTRNIPARIAILTVTVVCLAFSGCTSKEEAQRSNPPPINVDAQIKDIQNNPHMPQQAKDAAIATIRGQNAKAAAANASAPKK